MVGPMLPPGWGFGGGVRMPTCVPPAFRKHGVATARDPPPLLGTIPCSPHFCHLLPPWPEGVVGPEERLETRARCSLIGCLVCGSYHLYQKLPVN